MIKSYAIFFIAVAVSATGYCSPVSTDSVRVAQVINRVDSADNMLLRMPASIFANPALKQWKLPVSISSVTTFYGYGEQNEAVDVQQGSGSKLWGVQARSYMKHKTSTLWGGASYRNGVQNGVNWNESSDASIIYPYFTADSVGGDMKMEMYSLCGGYADLSDRWAWGAEICYNAGLYYRSVDPRPRNSTSRLDLKVGAAVRVGNGDYYAALSLSYRKYKQSCDIQFVNELADKRIWHLTGLGTHYERFAGSGYTHYYNGNRYGATLDIYPSGGRGFVATVGLTRFKFDHILTSLNKLPLQSAVDTRMKVMIGWLAHGSVHDLAVTASFMYGKRTGTENIFGDASANVYPMIASLDMYSHTFTEANVDVLCQWHPETWTVALSPRVAFIRSREDYVTPARHMYLGGITPGLRAKVSHTLGHNWLASVMAGFAISIAKGCSDYLPFDGSNPLGMQQVTAHRYQVLSHTHTETGVRAAVSKALGERFALSLATGYRRYGYTAGIHSDEADVALSFIF